MRFFCALLLLWALAACSRSKPPAPELRPESPIGGVEPSAGSSPAEEIPGGELPDLAETIARLAQGIADTAEFADRLRVAFTAAALPEAMMQHITDSMSASPAFILDLLGCLEEEPYLRMLVDKQHSLPQGYEPADLVELKPAPHAGRDGSYKVGRAGLMLRREAAESLDEMAEAAQTQGVTLVASSAYRSYNYQVEVYNRNVREMGQESADRESARPGYSQHQTGLVVDFGSIDDSFAETAAGRWIAANASRFGWSISFPQGYEAVTGYRWESWHYRYVGRELAGFIDNYFDGIQQYALRFLYEWETP
ncbi:hypothetical protein AGMMS50293_11090 [Spirochaetia bacterium]|nr:hypothetical protein AGMMS50293_11090 [Spirochaetia bacterium]